jgi:hypothetical protein
MGRWKRRQRGWGYGDGGALGMRARRGSSGSGRGGGNHVVMAWRDATVDDSEEAASTCPN